MTLNEKQQNTINTLKHIAEGCDLLLLASGEDFNKPLLVFDEINEVLRKLIEETTLYFYCNGIRSFGEYNFLHNYPDKKLGVLQLAPVNLAQWSLTLLERFIEENDLQKVILILPDNLKIETKGKIQCMSESSIMQTS